jgi:hypothetical protein
MALFQYQWHWKSPIKTIQNKWLRDSVRRFISTAASNEISHPEPGSAGSSSVSDS